MFILSVFTISLVSSAKEWSGITTKGISQDSSGNFQLEFERREGGKTDRIVLTDDEGIATLTATQTIIVNHIYQESLDKGLKMDSYYNDRLQSIQKDALDRLISKLQPFIDENKGNYYLKGAGMTIKQAVAQAKNLRLRYHVKMPWTVADVENMGQFLKKMALAGGPYSAKYTRDDKTREFDDILLHDPKNPKESFLQGALSEGYLLPSYFIEDKNHPEMGKRWVRGDSRKIMDVYEKDFERNSFMKATPKSGAAHEENE